MSWEKYYEKVPCAPRSTLVSALQHFKAMPAEEKLAMDLGCGNGGDTLELVKNGWKVIAIDNNAMAFEFLKANLPKELLNNVVFRLNPIEEIRWEKVSLINASFSLPFVQKEKFNSVWNNIVNSLKPEGIFAGHFFGKKDDWTQLALLSRKEVEELFKQFEIIELKEREEDAASATGPVKHWHIFEVIAKRI